jgi:hypothetical protein
MTNHSQPKETSMNIEYHARLNTCILFGKTFDVYPNVLHFTNKVNMFMINCFGLDYKHSDKIKFNIIDGAVQSLDMNVIQDKEKFLQVQIIPTSETGILEITDSFTSVHLTWEMNDKHIILKHGNDGVMIDYTAGVVKMVNVESNLMMIDFYNLCKTHTKKQDELDRLNRLIAKLQKEISYN